MSCPVRKYPYRTPKNHRVPVPRFTLEVPETVTHAFISYIGIQTQSNNDEALKAKEKAIDSIKKWLLRDDAPSAYESFVLIEGNDALDTVVWVCYWTDQTKQESSLASLNLSSLHQTLPTPGRSSIGLWHETLETEVPRLETNYSGLDYLPGLARLPEANTIEHKLSAYWGAARDRIPDSAHDLFPPPPTSEIKRPAHPPKGIGQMLTGTNHNNLVHIRSGQFWTNCKQREIDAYTQKLEPTLRKGLEYLRSTPSTGALGIRYLRNEYLPYDPSGGEETKESCGAGFFNNLEDLERWAHTHPSHLKIYTGALRHYKEFGDERLFRTWHEVCVVREGKARFEYVNCTPGTGVMGGLELEERGIEV